MRASISGSGILVTGGAGFIGSHLVERLYAEGAREVVIIDNLFLGNMQNLTAAQAQGAVLYRDDAEFMTSLEMILDKHSVDIVFNCATKALGHSFDNPANTFMVNPQVTINLLELQRRGRFSTLVQFSTSEVYGTALYEPMDEAHPIHPTTPYAAGKAAADIAVKSYVEMFALDCITVRPFNNYGPRQNSTGPMAAVIPRTVQRLLAGEAPVILGDGLQSRDFIHVNDTVDAVVKVYPVLASGESVNICTDGQVTINDVIEGIRAHIGNATAIDYQERRPCDVECHYGSNKKLSALIDFQTTPFEAGLKSTVDWYVTQLSSGLRLSNQRSDGIQTSIPGFP